MVSKSLTATGRASAAQLLYTTARHSEYERKLEMNHLVRRVLALLSRILPQRASAAAWKVAYARRTRGRYESGRPEEAAVQVFDDIYHDNYWGSSESRSGGGSTRRATRPIRKALPKLFRDLQIRSMLDAPCGDYYWMREVDLPAGCNYVGADIVPSLVGQLKREFPGKDFRLLNIVEDEIFDHFDLWLCRDVLFHLPEAACMSILRRASMSDINFFASTSFTFVQENVDVSIGGFRFINLTKPPFNLPEPMYDFDDFVMPDPPRIIGVWTKQQLALAVETWGSPNAAERQLGSEDFGTVTGEPGTSTPLGLETDLPSVGR